MSCDAAAASLIWLAALSGGAGPKAVPWPGLASALTVARTVPGVNVLAQEPLYAEIVSRAKRLKARVETYRSGAGAELAAFTTFKADIDALAALDMKGHLDLAARGTDGDLKCILKGISQDLPRKLADLGAAATPKDRAAALDEMFYLLRDNVEVITAPPAPPV